jgi:hypothetical protein
MPFQSRKIVEDGIRSVRVMDIGNHCYKHWTCDQEPPFYDGQRSNSVAFVCTPYRLAEQQPLPVSRWNSCYFYAQPDLTYFAPHLTHSIMLRQTGSRFTGGPREASLQSDLLTRRHPATWCKLFFLSFLCSPCPRIPITNTVIAATKTSMIFLPILLSIVDKNPAATLDLTSCS